eukprot:10315756-Lingulodinium_polyedra.AAC.1
MVADTRQQQQAPETGGARGRCGQPGITAGRARRRGPQPLCPTAVGQSLQQARAGSPAAC